MPQFIQEITSVSHSLLCCLKMNWRAPKHRQTVATMLMGKQSFPQRVQNQVLMHDSQEPDNPVEVWYGKGGAGRFLSAKMSVFFRSMGLMQSYKKGKLIHMVADVV